MSGRKKYDKRFTFGLSSKDDAELIRDIFATEGLSDADKVRNYIRLHSGKNFRVEGLSVRVETEHDV